MDIEVKKEVTNGKVAGCASIGAQPATFEGGDATCTATNNATASLEALAHKVLRRNAERNQAATSAENRRNFSAQNRGKKLRLELRSCAPEMLRKACLDLALKPEKLWRFLSFEDIENIKAGLIDFDTLRAYAERWNQHPYLVPVGNNLPYPAIPRQPDSEIVTCKSCRYFKPNKTGDGIGNCSKGLIGDHGKPLYPNAKRHCDSFKTELFK